MTSARTISEPGDARLLATPSATPTGAGFCEVGGRESRLPTILLGMKKGDQ